MLDFWFRDVCCNYRRMPSSARAEIRNFLSFDMSKPVDICMQDQLAWGMVEAPRGPAPMVIAQKGVLDVLHYMESTPQRGDNDSDAGGDNKSVRSGRGGGGGNNNSKAANGGSNAAPVSRTVVRRGSSFSHSSSGPNPFLHRPNSSEDMQKMGTSGGGSVASGMRPSSVRDSTVLQRISETERDSLFVAGGVY